MTYQFIKNKSKEGYFMLKSTGSNCNLLLKKIKIFKDGVKAKTNYYINIPPKLLDFETYYLEISKSKKIYIFREHK